jgi:hypothetical protein
VITRGAARVRVSASVPFELAPAVYWPDMGIEEETVRIIFHWPPGVGQATIQITADAGGHAETRVE